MGMPRGSVGRGGTLTYLSMSANALRACTWYIRHVDVFQRMTPFDIDALGRAMTPHHFAPGQLIVSAETPPELVCLTRTGTVRLFHREPDGHETTVDRLDAGHLFGVTGWLPADAGGLLAEAETNVEVCSVEGRSFLEVVSQWPQALLELALRLGVRVREGEEQLGRMTATAARARPAAPLHRPARKRSQTQ